MLDKTSWRSFGRITSRKIERLDMGEGESQSWNNKENFRNAEEADEDEENP
jgi:hypothetical protein